MVERKSVRLSESCGARVWGLTGVWRLQHGAVQYECHQKHTQHAQSTRHRTRGTNQISIGTAAVVGGCAGAVKRNA